MKRKEVRDQKSEIIQQLATRIPMLNNQTIAVIVPAYNEENQIGHVIENMPEFVDNIGVIKNNLYSK